MNRHKRRSVYHLAERYRDARGYERLSEHRGPFTRDEAERELRDAMSDPPSDRDESLCVVEVRGQWDTAEVVLTAEEIIQ